MMMLVSEGACSANELKTWSRNIGRAVVDVVGVFAWVAEQLDIVTDGVFCHGRKTAAYRRWRFIFLLGKLRELFKKKVGTARQRGECVDAVFF
ncbi:Uncharacterised protein [Mycobacteroides abscessus subsp. massiliense]|nr:Uncharacterised protein [Mycobacteroides abscessus subsp. massiliense]